MPTNRFLERAERTQNLTRSHRRAPKQEREIAHRVGGRVTPGSGARDVKGDVRVKGLLRIECKTTKNKSFSVTQEMLEKIEMAACSGGEMPVLIIEFIDDQGRKLKEVAVCPTYVLEALTQE